MTVLECPLCCAEVFSDARALEDHLLDLCENIVCPICESLFMTIQKLALHLRQGCSNKNETLETSLQTSCSEKSKQSCIKAYDEILADNNESKKTNNLSSGESSSKNSCSQTDSTGSVLPVRSDDRISDEDISKNDDPVDNNSDTLYSCSVCKITFPSVKKHLNEFHLNENVFVDNRVDKEDFVKISEDDSDLNLPDVKNSHQEGLNFSGVEFLPKETNSVIWTDDEVKSLLIVNWESDGNREGKKIDDSCPNEIDSFIPHTKLSPKNHWISFGNYFFYSANGDKRKEDFSNTVIIDNDYWQPPLEKYPLAMFIKSFDADHEREISCENKTYLFNGHRVRLLKIKCKDGILSIEHIPFLEEPPGTIVPVLEKTHLAPVELAGAYAVMWPCHLCGALAYHWWDLAKHCCSSSPKCFPCSLCKKTFHSRRSLNNHYSVLHKIVRSFPGCFSCPLCPANVQTSSHLEKHLAMHKKNDLVKCNFCDSLVQRTTYSAHVKAHGKNGSLSLVCLSCNRPFKSETDLNQHIPLCHLKDLTNDSLKCVICSTSFPDISALRKHMIAHDVPIKPHLCSFCPKSYYRLIDKVIHERVHTKSRPHSCNECGRCFRLRHSLVAHVRIHTGEKPFKCSSCDRTFRTKHLQRSHLLVHSALHQFKCRHCNKQFRTQGKMELHEKTHKKPFACSECKRVFYSLNFANKHMKNHEKNELNFTCNLCPNMFTRAAYLEAHLKKHHGLDTITSISISSLKTYQQMEESFGV